MQVGNLRKWLRAVTQEDEPDDTHWRKVVEIFLSALRDGNVSNKSMWKMVVLNPKGDVRDFRDIGLIEILWNTITGLINRRLTSAIGFYDVLHGLQAGRRTGTASLQAKLLQRPMAMSEVVLHEIFLEIQKAYINLYRDMCLNNLEGYGVFPRALRIICMYWGQITMVAKTRGY